MLLKKIIEAYGFTELKKGKKNRCAGWEKKWEAWENGGRLKQIVEPSIVFFFIYINKRLPQHLPMAVSIL